MIFFYNRYPKVLEVTDHKAVTQMASLEYLVKMKTSRSRIHRSSGRNPRRRIQDGGRNKQRSRRTKVPLPGHLAL